MSASPTQLESVNRPKQARSEQTLYRLLDAAQELIEAKGLADVSIPEIVARAGSSVGGFYARFKDKNALLRTLEERFFIQLSERLEELADPARWGQAEIPVIVATCVQELVSTTQANQNLIAAFLFRSAQDPEFREDGLRFRRRVSRRIGALLLPRRDRFGHPEPAVGIDLGVQLAFALMLQHVVFGETRAGGRALSDAALEREITRMFLGFLGYLGAVSTEPGEISQ